MVSLIVVRLHDVSRDGRLLLSSVVWATGIQFRGPGDAKERDLSWLDGTVGTDISSDGAKLAFEEAGVIYPLAGGVPAGVPGMTPEDIWANWTSDRKSAYVYQNMKVHDLVFRLDLGTGERQQLMEVAPQDTAGVNGLVPFRITPDGKAYAYTYNRALSTLFIADGVK
ncbi:MAG: hypothetical protein WCD43_18055 [Candidatus Acidiferrales bacterium]